MKCTRTSPTCRIPLDLTDDFVVICQGAEPPSAPLATEFHLRKCYSDPYKKRVLFVENGQVIHVFKAKETYTWEVLTQWWKKARTNQKIYFFSNVVNVTKWYTEMLHTISPSRHPSNRQGCRDAELYGTSCDAKSEYQVSGLFLKCLVLLQFSLLHSSSHTA